MKIVEPKYEILTDISEGGVEIDGPCSIKELAETVKNMEKIQLLLLKVALAFVKIDKESMVNENAAKNV